MKMPKFLYLFTLLMISVCHIHAADLHCVWVKYDGNPVLGGPELGTCFDANVILQGKAPYNMYFSWRPKKAIAISHSEDGISWTHPQIVLECDSTSGWEDIVNRSTTLYWRGLCIHGYGNRGCTDWL